MSKKTDVGSSSATNEISGHGKILHIGESFGLLRSSAKQTIFFGEKQFQPFTKGILETLKRNDKLHFEARLKKKGYVASKIWKPEANSACESSKSAVKPARATEMEAVDFLRCLLETRLSLKIGDLFLSGSSEHIRDLLPCENDVKLLVKRFPSVFQFDGATNSVSLVEEKVHIAIDCVVDQFEGDACLGLSELFNAVSVAAGDVRDILGHDEIQFKKFLRRYHDVFRLSKSDNLLSVSLRLDFAPRDSCDSQSVDSSGSRTTFSSVGVSSLSAASSVLSLNTLPNLHDDPSNSLPAPDVQPKQHGISKLLNALLNKEPVPLKNLIGYIHSSPPEVREVIGNQMDKFTSFIRNDEHFFLLEPHNQVFVRSTVEKSALRYLMDRVRQQEKVRLADLLKVPGIEKAPDEVRALLGKDLAEVLVSVRNLLAKQDLVPYCDLILQNGVISIRSSSQPESFTSVVSGVSNAAGDKSCSVAPGFSPESENKAVEFLRSLVERHKLLAVVNVKNYLWQAPSEVRQILATEISVKGFVHNYPSVFDPIANDGVIMLVKDRVHDAIAFFSKILSLRGDLPISSLVGHQSSATSEVRSVTGGSPVKVVEFFQRYFDIFRVYEGKKGCLMGALVGQKSTKRVDLATSKPETKYKEKTAVGSEVGAAQPKQTKQNEASGKIVNTDVSSDEPGLDFLMNLLRNRGGMRFKDIRKCVADASEEIRDDLGLSDKEILSFIEENPSVFKVSPEGQRVELVTEDEGDAIEFYLDVLNRRGPTPVSKIHGHVAQAAKSVQRVTGGSPESVTAFLLQFSNAFRAFEDKDTGVRMIESLYEGQSDNDKASTSAKNTSEQRKVSGPAVKMEMKAVSEIAVLNFDDIFGVSLLKSKKTIEQASSAQDEIQNPERLPDNNPGLTFDTVIKSEPSVVPDLCEGRLSKPNSDPCLASNETGLSVNAASSERETGAARVDAFTETQPCVEMSPDDSSLLPCCTDNPESMPPMHNRSEIMSVIDLVKTAKDEKNVVADLCYETLSSRRDCSDMAELLSICQLADPLGKQWRSTLNLKVLSRILESDDRFFISKENLVFLRRDVEHLAVVFLRECVQCYGPLVLSCVKQYDYLKEASALVRGVLAEKKNSTVFARKTMKSIYSKYRDQLHVEDGLLIVPYDVETDAIAFLSKLIETHGPLPMDNLYKYLLQAPVEVGKFFEEKLVNIRLYLTSPDLVNHFCLVDGNVDLVRNDNLLKIRLVTEQLASSFLVDVIRTDGPIVLREQKNILRKASPAVRQLLGQNWNAAVYKRGLLKNFCAVRNDVFVIHEKTIHLARNNTECQPRKSPSPVSTAFVSDISDDSTRNTPVFSKSAEEMAVEYLTAVITMNGALSLRKKRLDSSALLAAIPAVRILLGGAPNSLKFKKELVVKFCRDYPGTFTVYKRSVDLNRKTGTVKTVPTIVSDGKTCWRSSTSLGGGVLPSDRDVENVSEGQSSTVHEGQLITGSNSLNPRNVFTSAFSLGGTTASAPSSVPLFSADFTVRNQPPTHISFSDLHSQPLPVVDALRLSLPSASVPVLQQPMYFPMNQISAVPFQSLDPISLSTPLFPSWMAPGATMYHMPQYLGNSAPFAANNIGVPLPCVGSNMFVPPTLSSLQPAAGKIPTPQSSGLNIPRPWPDPTFQSPFVAPASFNFQHPIRTQDLGSDFRSDVPPLSLSATGNNIRESCSATHESASSVIPLSCKTSSAATEEYLDSTAINSSVSADGGITADVPNGLQNKRKSTVDSEDLLTAHCSDEPSMKSDEYSETHEPTNLQRMPFCDSVRFVTASDNWKRGVKEPEVKRRRSNSLPSVVSTAGFSTKSATDLRIKVETSGETESGTFGGNPVDGANVPTPGENASSRQNAVPVTWESLAASSCLPSFKEEFGQSLGELCDYIDYLHQEVFKSGSAEVIGDLCPIDHDHSGVGPSDDEAVDVKVDGTILSAEGDRLYVRCDNGRLIVCSSEIFPSPFRNCRNIGRHFAIGEKVAVVTDGSLGDFVVCHSSRLQSSETCCHDDSYIRFGRGRVSVLQNDLLVVATGNLEMASFAGEHATGLSLNEIVGFSARKVPHSLTPWRLDVVETADGVYDIGKGALPEGEKMEEEEEARPRGAADFGCQACPTSSSTVSTMTDVIDVCDQNVQTGVYDDGW